MAALAAARPQISPKTPDKVLKSLFDSYDSNNDGKLTLKEFDNLLGECGIKDEDEKMAITKLADSDNNHAIDYHEFHTLIKVDGLEQILDNEEDFDFLLVCYKTFKEYDTNGDGEVSWHEFYIALTKQGYTQDQITHYWYFYDTDSSQTITMTELFRGFLKQRQHAKQLEEQNKDSNKIDKKNSNDDDDQDTKQPD